MFLPPAAHRSDRFRVSGFVTITTAIVLGLIAVVIAMFMLIASTAQSRNQEEYVNATRAFWLADACGDYAIGQLQISDAYIGNQTLDLSQGTCTVLPIVATGSGSFDIHTEGRSAEAIGRVFWTVQLSAPASGSSDNTVLVQSHQRVIEGN